MGQKRKKTEKFYCVGCQNHHPRANFYVSYNKLHNGVYPYCKNFIKSYVVDEDGNIDMDKLYNILRQIDEPFLYNYWKISVDKGGDVVGEYFKNIKLRQNRSLKWEDSVFEEKSLQDITKDDVDIRAKHNLDPDKLFEITPEIVQRWGDGYTASDYRYLEEFYCDMHMTHTIVIPQHEKALLLICKLQLKMDKALESDDMVLFSKLHGEYQKLLTASGLRPIDKKGGAEATGIRSFSQIFDEVEKDGYIEPAPIKDNQDIVDKTIQYIMNYTLKLLNQQTLTVPPVDTPKVDVVDNG